MKLVGYDKRDFFGLGLIVLFVVGAASITTLKEENGNERLLESIGPSVLAADSARAILDLMNKERTDRGITSLQWSPILALTSYDKLKGMEKQHTFSHTLPDRNPFVDLIFAGGYPTRNDDGSIIYVGENLSCGYETAESALSAWMASEGHKRNILEPKYTEAGIAIGQVSYNDRMPCLTAVVHFGTRIIGR